MTPEQLAGSAATGLQRRDGGLGGDGDAALLEVRGLCVEYGSGPRAVRAVDRVDLTVRRGEIVGVAGESGSGKSTLAHAITRLLRPPAVVTEGDILYRPRASAGPASAEPIDILTLQREALRSFRWEEIAIVFQNAMSALNPVISIREQLTDAIHAHREERPRAKRPGVARQIFLELVGVNRDRLRSFPHELSGGMRQRVMIAMALALDADLLVMDEPTTALDVVTQNQILERLVELRRRLGFSVIFITHDLSLLLEMADTIAVMYAGRLVEMGPAQTLYESPRHPYTEGLLRSFPPLTGPRRELVGIPGTPPDLSNLPPGCPFEPRCSRRIERCRTQAPELQAVGSAHLASCWAPLEGGS